MKVTRSQRASDASPTLQRQQKKQEVCAEVVTVLKKRGNPVADQPGFADELLVHFNQLPTRYALDVNAERAEDVLTHKSLLQNAKDPENRPAFHVRAVHVLPGEALKSPSSSPQSHDEEVSSRPFSKLNLHAPPAFGSSANLEALAMDSNKATSPVVEDRDSSNHSQSQSYPHLPMHEVTVATIDKPKLLSQLSALLADVGLNIREAHVFSTVDGYSLDVFVVDGWPTEETEDLLDALQIALAATEKKSWQKTSSLVSDSPPREAAAPMLQPDSAHSSVLPSGTDDWEIDNSQLKYISKLANGSFGDLYRGTYCGQDVAIKILKPERLNENLQREFQQEVSIMRKVRHKNVVQFIGACTKPPNLCIVTEFMSCGSVYDYIHKQKAVLKLPMLLRVAIDISKGMDYLHQNNIIHRDLKAANLLMDENEVVKVADFGVARVQAQSGVMTAETGTYRWMAPEVIEHKPYDRKADVFSFAIVLWELLTGKIPYENLTPLQAAVGVVQKGLRPTIPSSTPPKLAELLERCWATNSSERPEFSSITTYLQEIVKELPAGEGEPKRKDKKLGGLFSHLKRTSH
ncbi:unnamed protein product [Sphagnum troendelagicum]|uniref:Serine/threonine-protein kinase STY46 n=1 Tax=Sphagnum troendelagicum TaxID=128251 RepID=A0ABP0TSS1_9BRYO